MLSSLNREAISKPLPCIPPTSPKTLGPIMSLFWVRNLPGRSTGPALRFAPRRPWREGREERPEGVGRAFPRPAGRPQGLI